MVGLASSQASAAADSANPTFTSAPPRRRWNPLLPLAAIATLAAVWLFGEATVAAGAGDRPNVVIVMADDQGYGDLGAHGNPKIRTPNLDVFAAGSVELRQFYVSPVCSPTRASLLTGRYNAGLRGRKGSVYDRGIRVACYVRWPRVLAAGHKVERIAAHIDLAPTVLEACGVAPPASPGLDGNSLLALLLGRGGDWPDRTLYFQWHRGDEPQLYRAFAARSERWKLVQPQGAGPGEAPVQAPLELYDMAGQYQITLSFAESAAGMARLVLGDVQLSQPIDQGATRCKFGPVRLPAGAGRLEASIAAGDAAAIGVEYVEVERLD